MKQSAEEQNPLYDNHSANAQNAHVGRERDMSVYDFVTAAAQLTSFSSEFTIPRVSQSTAAVMFVCSALHLFLCILYVCVQKKNHYHQHRENPKTQNRNNRSAIYTYNLMSPNKCNFTPHNQQQQYYNTINM